MQKLNFPFSFFIAVIAVIALLFFPVKIPLTIKTPGKILPGKEWILIKGQDGVITSITCNNILDFAESSGNTQTERGDQESFRFHPNMIMKETVSAGDTVGLIYSYEVELQWAQLTGELAIEEASLRLYESGEKEPMIREALLKLDYAKKQAEQQNKEIERISSLAEKSMIAPAVMEREQTKLQLYEIQVNTAEAALNSVETGYKKEQTDLIKARIHTLKESISVMKKRMNFSTITTPISGRIVRFAGSDTLAIVQDTTSFALVLPVEWYDRKYISQNQIIRLKAEGICSPLIAKIEHIGNNLCMINGKNFIRGAALIDGCSQPIVPGLIVQCSILCRKVSLVEYLLRYFR
jgi:hypothetical protein